VLHHILNHSYYHHQILHHLQYLQNQYLLYLLILLHLFYPHYMSHRIQQNHLPSSVHHPLLLLQEHTHIQCPYTLPELLPPHTWQYIHQLSDQLLYCPLLHPFVSLYPNYRSHLYPYLHNLQPWILSLPLQEQPQIPFLIFSLYLPLYYYKIRYHLS